MAVIEFVKPTEELVRAIADDMRANDVNEIWASNLHSPIESLMKGWRISDYATIAMTEGKPLVMFGLVKGDLLSGHGVIWMLGTNEAMKYKRDFLIQTPAVLNEMLNICSRLGNMVHNKNKDSIRWLRWLGFTIDEPIKYGPLGELFHPFYLEK